MAQDNKKKEQDSKKKKKKKSKKMPKALRVCLIMLAILAVLVAIAVVLAMTGVIPANTVEDFLDGFVGKGWGKQRSFPPACLGNALLCHKK